MFDLEPNSASDGARNVQITSNVTGVAGNFWLASKGDGRGMITDVTITDNTTVGATGNLVWVSGGTYRGPFVIERNRFRLRGTVHDSSSRGAFFFDRCADITIEANHADFPTGENIPAVEIRDSQHVTVENNSFPNAGQLILDTTHP